MTKVTNSSRYWLLLALTVVVFFLLRLPQVLRGEFAFVFDMGRDHIWVRNMVELKKPTLIGPWGSLAGVYMGPAWYYFLAIPYIISSGDPRASVVWVMIANLAAMLLGTWFLKKEISVKSALLFAFIFALSPHNINITTYPFHANILPLTMILMLISMYHVLHDRVVYLWLAALATSLNFHFEPAAGVFTTLTLIIFLLWQRKKLTIQPLVHSAIAFVAPFIPQLIFELRHQFLQTKAVIAYFQGQNRSLEGVLPFPERIFERLRKFTELFSASVLPSLPLLLTGSVLVIMLIYLWRTKKTKNELSLFSVLLFSLLLPLFSFMFFFPPELKGWYLYGFSISYFMLITLFLHKFINSTHAKSSRTYTSVLSLVMILYFVWLGQLHRRLPALTRANETTDPAMLKTQLQAIEQLYQLSQGKAFSVYVYTPPIYDYQYQYLIWWFSRQHNLPLPVEYSYLPSETNYHPHKQQFSLSPWKTPEIIYLLLEPETDQGRLQGWLGHFANLEKDSETTFASNISFQVRLPN